MPMIAAILLMFLVMQNKPAPTAEQLKQAPGKEPEQKASAPIVLPKAKSMRVTIQEGQSSVVVIVLPNGEREILSDDEVTQLLEAGKPKISLLKTEIVVVNGKVYLNTGGVLAPMTGGGASGCFGVTPERNEQIQKEVRRQLEKEKADAEKKK